MTLRDYLTELKEFLTEWSGKLAAIAAVLTSIITAIPPEWAGMVLGFLPDGPLRLVLALALAVIVLVLPKMAKKKDEKLAEAHDGAGTK